MTKITEAQERLVRAGDKLKAMQAWTKTLLKTNSVALADEAYREALAVAVAISSTLKRG